MTPEQEREFRALLAEVDEENSGWRSVMDPVAAELQSLRAEVAILKEQLAEATDFGGRESERVDALSAHLEGAEMVALGAKEEARDLRAALAASQAREAALRQASNSLAAWAYCIVNPGVLPSAYDAVTALLDDPSPASDALGRVARASVAATKAEWEPDRATLDRARIAQRAAVDALLAVAPHWGEPRGAG